MCLFVFFKADWGFFVSETRILKINSSLFVKLQAAENLLDFSGRLLATWKGRLQATYCAVKLKEKSDNWK